MTTITIQNGEKFSRTHFKDFADLANFVYDYYMEQELPPLSAKEIAEAEAAMKKWKNDKSSFKRVILEG